MLDLDKVKPFFHFLMLGLEGRERGEVIKPVDLSEDADVFTGVSLSLFAVVKEVRGKGEKIINVVCIDLVDFQ